MKYITRRAEPLIREALQDTPVVVVQGPRQAGKSTLVSRFLGSGNLETAATFDDLDVRAAATADPQGFVAGLGRGAIIDEVQRVPDVILAIKAAVDRDRQPGRFLLTGSANPFHRHEETLAGRREDIHLWPLAQAELEGAPHNAVDLILDPDPAAHFRRSPEIEPQELLLRALRGGYPAALERTSPDRHQAWFRNYVAEVVRAEVADLAAIEGLLDLPRLLRLAAHRSAGLLSVARLARDADLPQQTARRYLALLVETFLVLLIPAWTRTGRKRLVKSPKALVSDSGLMAALTDLSPQRIERTPEHAGPLLETFLLTEATRLAPSSRHRPVLHHFRTDRGREVDGVLEDASGRVVGIEVKAGVSVVGRDFDGLHALAEAAGREFHVGVVFHPGHAAVAFGEQGEIGHSVFVYDTTLRVPLIFAGPEIPTRTVSTPVSLGSQGAERESEAGAAHRT